VPLRRRFSARQGASETVPKGKVEEKKVNLTHIRKISGETMNGNFPIEPKYPLQILQNQKKKRISNSVQETPLPLSLHLVTNGWVFWSMLSLFFFFFNSLSVLLWGLFLAQSHNAQHTPKQSMKEKDY
jgi:hypothetical protein